MRRLALGILLSLASAALLAGVPDRQRQTELIDILQQDCGSCHGMTLKGGLGPSLLPDQLRGKPRDFLIATIREGRPGTAMPPWGPILKESEIAWLVDQLLAGKGAYRQ